MTFTHRRSPVRTEDPLIQSLSLCGTGGVVRRLGQFFLFVRSRSFVLTLFGFVQLLREIVFVGHLFDRVQLTFEPIDVVFFVEQDLLQ